jgi:lipopolysaccharide heptosyltransferase II
MTSAPISPFPDPSWQEARRILAIRLDAMGDVLMTAPALRQLKHATPEREVVLLTSPSGAAITPLLPYVDATMVYQAPWMKAGATDRGPGPDLDFIGKLHEQAFDAAVIFTVYSQSPLPAALLCHLAGIPLRLAHCRENPYHLLTHWVPEQEPHAMLRHEVLRQLALVEAVGLPARPAPIQISIPETARTSIATLLNVLRLPPDGWYVVHPGATVASRRYPADSFAQVVARVHETTGMVPVYTGCAEEAPLIEAIQHASGLSSFSLAGELQLAELAALLERTRLLLCNNTGPAHLAAATGTPVASLYALTNPQHTPWHVPCEVLYHDVPCRYCYKSQCPEGHHDCLGKLAPQTVVDAVLRLLESTASRPHLPALAGRLPVLFAS